MKKEKKINEILGWIRNSQNDKMYLYCVGRGVQGRLDLDMIHKSFLFGLEKSDKQFMKILGKLNNKDLIELVDLLNYPKLNSRRKNK